MEADAHFVYQELGFDYFHARPGPPQGHIHDSFEISVVEGEALSMLFGGRKVLLEPDCLVVHWGMLPHEALHCSPGTKVVGLHIPLAWFLQWRLPAPLLRRLLNMELLIEPPRCNPCHDLALVRDWCQLLRGGSQEGREIVLAEARARLLRMAHDHACRGVGDKPVLPAESSDIFSRVLDILTQHFREPLRIPEIARKVGIGERQLARIFQERAGQGINHYLLRLRVAHAQWLLATGRMKVLDIMYASGFTCPTHFYKTFHTFTGLNPGGYRRKISAAGLQPTSSTERLQQMRKARVKRN